MCRQMDLPGGEVLSNTDFHKFVVCFLSDKFERLDSGVAFCHKQTGLLKRFSDGGALIEAVLDPVLLRPMCRTGFKDIT